jgi:predicted GTPase
MTDQKRSQKRPMGIPRLVLLVVALLLPTLSLLPLGTLWLWEKGYIVYWAVGTCLVVAGVYYLQRRLLVPPPPAAAKAGIEEPHDTAWTPRQEEAWADVMRVADTVRAERITSRDAVLALGLETIEVVARRLHPERRDPLLQFTVPEALAVVERASANLHGFLVGSFPLGDRITVAQLMWLYRWRGALQLAEKGYDLWRIVRLLNPVSAATQEVRERFTRQIYEAGREHLARRLAQAFVREVGRAAIDLYGGNLRVTAEQLSGHVTSASRRDAAATEAREAEPIRILVAGQSGAGKSTLVNALANSIEAAVDVLPSTARFSAYRLTREGLPAAVIIDSPGLDGSDGRRQLIEATRDCDLVLWVASAARAARDVDAAALAAIREHFAAEPRRRQPPMVLILTHVDQLRPFSEWAPPYDLADGSRAKAAAIRGAMEVAGKELGFAAGEIIPVRADAAAAPYNIDALWAKLIELMPEAQRARLLRTLQDIKSAPAWRAVWSQAANAGRVIAGTLLSRSPNP